MAKHRSKRGPKLGPIVWVVRHGARFSVKEERRPAYIIPPVPQRTAIVIARFVARANRNDLIVQGRSGRIRVRTGLVRISSRREADHA